MRIAGTKITLEDIQDSEILEDFFQTQVKHRNTKRAIKGTYKSEFISNRGRKLNNRELSEEDLKEMRRSDKPFTKARRKLVGRNGKPRTWKKKHNIYAKLETHMLVTEFNKRGVADQAQKRMIKRMADKRKKLSLQED